MVSYDDAIAKFQDILKFSDMADAIRLADSLQDGLITGGDVFITMMEKLQVLSSTGAKSIGAGASGTIMREPGTKIIYKEIAITGNTKEKSGTIINGTYTAAELNKSLKKIFFEAWIQTVLGLDRGFDPTRGSRIAKITGMYKRPSSEPYNDKFIIIVIEMDLLGDSVEDYIKPGALIQFSYIQASVIDLINILKHFNDTYGFVHRDLHANNVMFNSRKITLIDFGLSCFFYYNSSGALVKYVALHSSSKAPCQSFDMYIFLASLLHPISRQYLSEACIEKIKSFFDVVTPFDRKVVNLFKVADVDPYRNSVFHHFYEWHIRDLLSFIPPAQQSPAAHLAIIMGLVSGTASVSGAGGGGGASNSASASSAVTATGTVGKVTAAELAASGPMTSAYGCEGGCFMRWLGLRGGSHHRSKGSRKTRRRYKKKGRTQKRHISTFRH